MNLDVWENLRHLFENDDGSLPDIFVENMTKEQIVNVYNWIVSKAGIYGEPTLWSIKEDRDIPIKKVNNPAQKFVNQEVETFRHGLENFNLNGIKMPPLTICVETGGLSFDYRKGKDWGVKEVNALFDFLIMISQMSPDSKIIQAEEGSYETPSSEFSKVFQEMKRKNS